MNGAQHCPECGSKMSVKDTAHGGDKTYRVAACTACGERWETTETRTRRLPHMGTGSHKPAQADTGSGTQQPAETGAHPPPPVSTRPHGQGPEGVGGGLPSVSGPDPDSGPISPADPDRARVMSGHELCRLFSQVRARAVGGLPWQSVRVAGGAASDMAAAINEDPAARADVVPSMELLFKLAKAGKAGDRSSDIVKSGSFAFGAWCSKWTELREQLHAKLPRAADDTAVRATAQRIAGIMAAGSAPAPTREQLAALRPPKRVSVVIKESDGSERPVDMEATG